MALKIADVEKIQNLRKQILENQKEGRPSYEGIDEEVLRLSLEKIRHDRSVGKARKKKAAKKKVTKRLDIDNLFG